MAVISVLRQNGNNVTQAKQGILRNVKISGVDYHFAKENEVTDGVCDNAVAEPIIDMRVKGDSIQDGTPTPETPIEIQSVGNRTKNLFDIDYSNIQRCPYNATTERWGYDVGVLPAGDYNFSFELVDETDIPQSIYVRKKSADGTVGAVGSLITSVVVNNPLKFTADGETNYYLVCASGSVSTLEQAKERMEKIKYIQLEVGTKATEYEPYGYKIPIKITPTEYLFTPDKIAVHQISATASRCGFDLGVLDAGDYTIDFDLVEAGKFPEYVYMRCKHADGTYSDNIYITSTVNFAPETFTTDGQSNYYLFFATIPSDTEEAKKQFSLFRNIYLQKGSSIQSTSTTIYLTHPLRKIGSYVDYIDYKNKKIVRNVKEFVPSGSEGWLIDTSSGYNRHQYLLSDALIGDKSLSLCNMFNWVSGNSQDNSFVIGSRTPYLYVRYDSVADVTEWKEFLTKNKLSVIYPLETSIEESIDTSTFETLDNTTIIDIDTEIEPSGINITYWKQITPEEVDDV